MIVIGDCHGSYKELMELIDILPKNRKLCFVGDLIDRGPDSKKVVDFVIDNNYQCVMGNHEDFTNSISYDENNEMIGKDRYLYEDWILNGGNKTIKKFGDSLSNYLDWFYGLPLTITVISKEQTFLISHSYAYNGVNTSEYDLLWGRRLDETPTKELDNIINIYGHTPHNKATQYHNKHWCVDTGCFHTGILTAIDLKDMKIYKTKGRK